MKPLGRSFLSWLAVYGLVCCLTGSKELSAAQINQASLVDRSWSCWENLSEDPFTEIETQLREITGTDLIRQAEFSSNLLIKLAGDGRFESTGSTVANITFERDVSVYGIPFPYDSFDFSLGYNLEGEWELRQDNHLILKLDNVVFDDLSASTGDQNVLDNFSEQAIEQIFQQQEDQLLANNHSLSYGILQLTGETLVLRDESKESLFNCRLAR